MRKWTPATWPHAAAPAGAAVAPMIDWLGDDGFEAHLLQQLHPVLPAASWSVYQVGPACVPRLFMSAALGIPDTTRACWGAYLSGPYREDRSLRFDGVAGGRAQHLCHILAQEVPAEHRARVYDAHGMAERVSVVEHADDGALFAVNFYRHAHQRPLTDAEIAGFEQIAPALLALARKHVALRGDHEPGPTPEVLRQRLLQRCAALTVRELDVCTRVLRGMTHDGIAADLGVSVPTVKTYRNRAFERLGIHFRNELFALALQRELQ